MSNLSANFFAESKDRAPTQTIWEFVSLRQVVKSEHILPVEMMPHRIWEGRGRGTVDIFLRVFDVGF